MITQVGFLLVARNSAEMAVTGASIAAAREGAEPAAVAADLRDQLVATVPGIIAPEVEVIITNDTATASTSFGWVPPGPGWTLIRISVDAAAPLVVAP